MASATPLASCLSIRKCMHAMLTMQTTNSSRLRLFARFTPTPPSAATQSRGDGGVSACVIAKARLGGSKVYSGERDMRGARCACSHVRRLT